MNEKTVFGVGINDANYTVFPIINGKQKMCPFYRKWRDMIGRCYNKKYQINQPTYKSCEVHQDWHYFMNFRSWMTANNWEGLELDKDLIVLGNSIYSKDLCVFIPKIVNTFTCNNRSRRGNLLIGVTMSKHGKYSSSCSNPFTKEPERLGNFNTEIEAHTVWRKRKHELACKLAESDYVKDQRVAKTLKWMYSEKNSKYVCLL